MDQGGQQGTAAPAHMQQQTPPLPLVPEPKRHAACDECRTRKLKCSGHRPACERCTRENLLPCVYSLQKQMGRPRKRRRAGEDPNGADSDSLQGKNGHVTATLSPPGDYDCRDSQQRNGSGGSGLDMGFEEIGFGGFEGFAYGDAGDGRSNSSSVDVFDLDPTFGLDSLLAGALADDLDGSGAVGQQAHSAASILSRDIPPATHDQSISHQSLVSPPLGLPCACLSNIYLTLSSLHSLSSHNFPFVLPSIRTAIATANTVLNCPHCPLSHATASQNIHMLISLLMTLIDSVYKLLTTIDSEAQRVDAAGTKKPFVLADASAPAHMHSGTGDCPVRFGMELSGSEWRELARRVVKSQIIGNAAEAEAGGCEGTVYGTLAAFVRRQHRWHDDPQMLEIKKNALGGNLEGMEELGEKRLCVQNVEAVTVRMKLLDI